MLKYLKIIQMIFTNKKQMKFMLLSYLFRFVRVALLLSIWQVLFDFETNQVGMSISQVLKYTFLAEVFGGFLNINTGFVEELCYGSITRRFQRPMGIFTQIGLETIGRCMVNFLFFSIPLLLLSPLFGIQPLPENALQFILFMISLLLAIVVGLLIDFLFASFTISLEQNMDVVNQVRTTLTMILSGAFIPLVMLPWGIGGAISLLPFATLASVPLQIYLNMGNAFQLIGLQIFWTAALIPLTLWVWRHNREKIISFGG